MERSGTSSTRLCTPGMGVNLWGASPLYGNPYPVARRGNKKPPEGDVLEILRFGGKSQYLKNVPSAAPRRFLSGIMSLRWRGRPGYGKYAECCGFAAASQRLEGLPLDGSTRVLCIPRFLHANCPSIAAIESSMFRKRGRRTASLAASSLATRPHV